MAYSRIIKIGDGATTQFTVNFALGYNSTSEVTCRVGNEVDGLGSPVYRSLTFLSSNLVQVSGAPAGVGVQVVFERTVSKTQLAVDFTDGDVLDETNLNTAQKQALMMVHEVLDGRFAELNSDISFGGYKIKNLGTPTDANDGANKAYVDAATGGLAAISTQITTVAGIASSIPPVAAIAANVTAVASNATNINKVAAAVNVLNGTAAAISVNEDVFTADGVATTYTLSVAPLSKANILVFVGGAVQPTTDFSLSGFTLTISPAVDAGTQIIVRNQVFASVNSVSDMKDAAVAAKTAAEAARDSAIAAANSVALGNYYLKTEVDNLFTNYGGVKYTTQTPSTAQQTQARTNVGIYNAPCCILEDSRAANTSGDTLSAGINTRTINTVLRNDGTLVTRSGNQFTPSVDMECVAQSVSTHDRARLLIYNVTDGTYVGQGLNSFSNTTYDSRTYLTARARLIAGKTYEVRHYAQTAATIAYAINNSGLPEKYLIVELWRLV